MSDAPLPPWEYYEDRSDEIINHLKALAAWEPDDGELLLENHAWLSKFADSDNGQQMYGFTTPGVHLVLHAYGESVCEMELPDATCIALPRTKGDLRRLLKCLGWKGKGEANG